MGGAAKAVKKVVKSTAKVVKAVTKPITKVVKTVAKTISKVGKAVVSGVKSAVKSVGKSLSKLGPLASIALMAIPGFQAFGASLASGMGFSSTLAANMATGAMTGFITSGGSLKGALTGGVMAGAGSYLGDVAKGAWNSGSLSTGFAQANAAAMAPNAFTGGATGMAGFNAGIDAAKAEWGNFTNKVGDFFSSQTSTGDITTGTEAFAGTYEKYGMSPTEYMDTYGKLPDVATSAGTQQQQMLYEQNKAFFDDAVVPEGTPEYMKQDWARTVNDLGIDPAGQQAKMLAQQEFGGIDPTKYDSTMALSIDPTTGNYDPSSMMMTAESGVGGTPFYMAAPTTTDTGTPDKPKGLLSPDSDSPFSLPFIKSVTPIDQTVQSAGAGTGTGGMLGFTDIQRQTQAQLIAQAERQAELARQQAAKGWGIA